ncbi:hypothetical protein GW915_03520 [bacterium]|nr:hypothetical protein [bacterium]
MGKNLFITVFSISFFAFSKTASSTPNACTGQEVTQAQNLSTEATQCKNQNKEELEVYKAASVIDTSAIAIKGYLTSICSNSEKGMTTLDQGQKRLSEATQRTQANGELNQGTAEAATAAYTHAGAAKDFFNLALNSMPNVEGDMRTIESQQPTASGKCPEISSNVQALRNAINEVSRKLNQDKQLAEGLEQKAKEIANVSNQTSGQAPASTAGASGAGAQSPQPEQAQQQAPASQPANNQNDDQSQQGQQGGGFPGGGDQGGNSGGNDKQASTPPPITPPAPTNPGESFGESDSSKTIDELLAKLEEKSDEKEYENQGQDPSSGAAYIGPPSSIVDVDSEGNGAAPAGRTLGFASVEDERKAAKKALAGLNTESAKVKATEPNNDSFVSAPSGGANTSFLQSDLPVGRALASPENSQAASGFKNLSVEDALKKINQIPISK